MSRRVRALPPKALGAAAAAQPVEIDSYFDKVLKYIPADIVAAWVAVTGLVSSARDIPQQAVLWVAFGIGLLLTGWWTWKQASVPGRRPPVTQALISTVAFAVWVFALGGPFQHFPGREVYGSLLLILYTLVAALVNPQEG